MNAVLAGLAPWQMNARTLAAGYARGTLSPVDVFESVQQRMQAVQPVLNAIVHWDDRGARQAAYESAARWRAGTPLSPLDGVPLTVKDNIPVRGMPCRWGSKLYAGHVAMTDEQPVARLRAAGAVLLGKTNVPEFTLLGYTDNLLAGPTRNPWNPALTPGGSSGGAVAAVASGIGPLALCTDGGGSIRRPCSHTGVVGLKPSWGRVLRADGLPELLPGMEVAGPVARSVGDLVRMLAVIGPKPEPVARGSAAPRRIVCWTDIAGSPVDEEILAGLEQACTVLRRRGHIVTLRDAPAIVDAFNREAWPVLSGLGLAGVLALPARQQGYDAVAAQLTPAMRAMWQFALGRPLAARDAANALVRELRASLDMLFQSCDVLLTPAAAALPWPATETHPARIAGQEVGPRGHAVFTAFVNACGLPALALPMGQARHGLPFGMQLVGPHGADEALCQLGLEWEAAQPQLLQWPRIDNEEPEE